MTTLTTKVGGYDFAKWRAVARDLIGNGIAPDRVRWSDADDPGTDDLFAVPAPPFATADSGAVHASREYMQAAKLAILHRDPARHALLYRLLWRMQRQRGVMRDQADPEVRALDRLVREVRRDIHKMRAFVRFSPVSDPDGHERYVAWFEPAHHIVEANADFFIGRFHSMRWSIMTPERSVHWDGAALSIGPGGARPGSGGDGDDPFADMWLRYYAAIFNPARLKITAMTKEMPKKYWRNLPEAALIPDLIAGAQERERRMVADGGAHVAKAHPSSLDEIAAAIAQCRSCPIGCNGTRAVAGEGPKDAALMIVGEQPGNSEETAGRPFVGPAGQVLDAHLARAGIDRSAAWVTNAVKHFKYEVRGGERIHQTPTASEIDHCRWWLDSERALLRPRTIIALGASAGRAILGRTPSINRERGRPIMLADGARLWLTAHPSYLLRLPEERRVDETARFQADLLAAATSVGTKMVPATCAATGVEGFVPG